MLLPCLRQAEWSILEGRGVGDSRLSGQLLAVAVAVAAGQPIRFGGDRSMRGQLLRDSRLRVKADCSPVLLVHAVDDKRQLKVSKADLVATCMYGPDCLDCHPLRASGPHEVVAECGALEPRAARCTLHPRSSKGIVNV